MIARADPNKIDPNDLRRIFMSEGEKERLRVRSARNYQRQRENMTEEELTESRTKARERFAQRRTKMIEEARRLYVERKGKNNYEQEAMKCKESKPFLENLQWWDYAI